MRHVLFFAALLLSFPALANTIEEDQKAARIIAYYGIGHEDSPATSVTLSQFKAHLKELDTGKYSVIALPDMLNAYEKNVPLPKNSVTLTFDGSEKSVLMHAAPLLKERQYPFTVFLSPERIRDDSPRYLNRKNIKHLQKLQLVTFGIHPEDYESEEINDLAIIRKNLNNSVSFYRNIFNERPEYLAFPNGLYSERQLEAVRPYKFQALLGQQSGVVYHNKPNSILPRFVMTENYADLRRFKMIANALPIPSDDINPKPSVINTNDPIIGFTTSNKLNLDKLSCYASGQEKPVTEKLNNRIEIRLKQKISESRFRVNCTLPVLNEDIREAPKRWRWFGLLLNTVN